MLADTGAQRVVEASGVFLVGEVLGEGEVQLLKQRESVARQGAGLPKLLDDASELVVLLRELMADLLQGVAVLRGAHRGLRSGLRP